MSDMPSDTPSVPTPAGAPSPAPRLVPEGQPLRAPDPQQGTELDPRLPRR